MQNDPSGAGSQLDARSAPGDSFVAYRTGEPSSSIVNWSIMAEFSS
jgi:hypothetical protein